MKKSTLTNTLFSMMSFTLLLTFVVIFMGCDDDPEPVNEEEVITTVNVLLTPAGGGSAVTLRFYDADGDGSVQPVTTVSGNLLANKTYNALITLQNEAGSSPEDITAEVAEEADEHLFCFTVTGSNLTIAATDRDSNGLAIGLASTWTTTAAGNASVRVVLRHQPGTKDGNCPGSGETDVDVTFNVTVQ